LLSTEPESERTGALPAVGIERPVLIVPEHAVRATSGEGQRMLQNQRLADAGWAAMRCCGRVATLV